MMDFRIHCQVRTYALAPWLTAAAVFSCLAGSTAAAAPRLLGAPGASPATWVMADFNGDRKDDLVTVVATSPFGQARRHQLQVQLNAQHAPALAVSRFAAGDRLNVRDLDGDSDRDIVLETAFGEPVAVWLNDGAGHFDEGNVDSFRFQFSHDDHRSFDAPERPSPSGLIGEYTSRDAVSSRYATLDSQSPGAILTVREGSAGSVHPSAIRTRGPPSRS
jgi:hypothetical protein